MVTISLRGKDNRSLHRHRKIEKCVIGLRTPRTEGTPFDRAAAGRVQTTRESELAVDNNSHDHGAIEQDPADAGQINILVALLYSKTEPKDGRNKVGAPG